MFRRIKREVSEDPEETDESVDLEDEESKKAYIDQIVAVQNLYRQKHGVPPLKFSKKISEFSQYWADRLFARRALQHSSRFERPDYGENIFYSNSKYIDPNIVVQSWYTEVEADDYDYTSEPPDLSVGHFTQLIWKSSTEVGVGVVAAEHVGIYVVCNYEPAGNIKKKFLANVPPPMNCSIADYRMPEIN